MEYMDIMKQTIERMHEEFKTQPIEPPKGIYPSVTVKGIEYKVYCNCSGVRWAEVYHTCGNVNELNERGCKECGMMPFRFKKKENEPI